MKPSRKFHREHAAEIFPAMAYNDQDQLFYLDPKSLGFGFICEPLFSADDKTGDRINVLLNQDWPKDTIVQFCLYTNPDIERFLDDFTEMGIKEAGLLGQLRPEAAEFFRDKTSSPLSSQSNLRIRDIQLLLTVRVPLKNAAPTQKEMEAVTALRRTVEQSLSTGGFRSEVITAKKYIRLMSVIFNRGPNASWRRDPLYYYDSNELVRDQILDLDTEIRVDSKGISLGDHTRIKTLSVKRFPEYGALGVARRFLSEPLTGSRGIRENVLITASLLFPDTDSMRSRLEKEKQWVTNQAYGPMLKFAPRLADQKYSFDSLFESLEDGDRIVKLYLGVTLFTDPEEEDAAVSNARTYWREGGYQLMEDRFLCLPLLLNNLPFGAEADAAKDLMRYKTMGTRHALTQIPVFGAWKGTGTPIMQFIGREGQLMNVSMFDSGSNYNTVIAAASGKGKSFLTNDAILNTLATGGRAWVIDVGRSYEKLCKHVGGQFLEFGADSDICLNPFDLVQNYDEEADMLVGIISAMAAPTQALTDLQTAGLRRIMNQVWNEEGTSMTIDSLAEALKKDEILTVKDLGEQLYPFTKKGEYGRFFSGRNNVNFNDSFAVIELEELKGRKHLQQVVLLLIIFQIQINVYLGKRDRQKIVIIDEAWEMLAGGDVAKFIETAYRRFRKYGAACICCTQSMNDLYNSPSGKAIAENSANKYLLGQNRETVLSLEKEGRLDIGEFGYELLKTVHTIPGHYSEIFFMTEYGAGIGRLYVDHFKQILYSTKADDVEAVNKYVARGLSHEDAIKAVLKERRIAA